MAASPSALRVWALVALVFIVPFLWMTLGYAAPVLGGLVLATVSYPLYARLRRYLRPTVAGLTLTASLVAGVVVPVAAIAFAALAQARELAEWLSDDSLTADAIARMARRWPTVHALYPSNSALAAQLRAATTRATEALGDFALSRLAGMSEVAIGAIVLVTATFYFLVDGRRLFHWVRAMTPLSRRAFNPLVHAFTGAARGSVLSSLAGSALHGAAIFLTFGILGVPGTALAAGAGFVLSWIPMLGVIPVWGAGALALASDGNWLGVACVAIAAIAVAVVDTMVRPLVLRGHHELHPLLGLVSLLGGLSAFGVLGLLIGPVLAAMVVAAFEVWPLVARQEGMTLNPEDTVAPPREDETAVKPPAA